MNTKDFINSERERASRLFSTKHKSGFKDSFSFSEWFTRQLIKQNLCCYYCETSILTIRSLIDKGLLKTRATGYGCRGPVLEVDKKENNSGYTTGNCVLACYYCNNDKSYTLDAEAYKQFFGSNRKAYFEYIVKEI